MSKKKFIVKSADEYVEKNLEYIEEFIKLLKSKKRRKILELCYKKPTTIADLKRAINSSNKYTWWSVKHMSEIGIVELDKRTNERFQPVYVKSLYSPEEIVDAFMNFLSDHQHMLNVKISEKK